MRRTIMTLAAVSGLAIAAPAAAQYLGGNFETRVQQLQADIQIGVRDGTIRRADARTLREHLRALRQTERTYAINGFTSSERRHLQDRVQNLRQQIRYAERVGDNRYAGSGFIDRNRDGWDDRDYDRDGRMDGYYGQGGPLEDAYVCENRGGIGGVLDSVLGRDCLRIGERAPSSLYAVPYAYRNSYRDGYGTYYRSDGRAIYRIDARTNTVVDIYPMSR